MTGIFFWSFEFCVVLKLSKYAIQTNESLGKLGSLTQPAIIDYSYACSKATHHRTRERRETQTYTVRPGRAPFPAAIHARNAIQGQALQMCSLRDFDKKRRQESRHSGIYLPFILELFELLIVPFTSFPDIH